MKGSTELCLSKFRVRRSLQKNATKNKKGNDKKKKEKNKKNKKKKKKREKKNKSKDKREKKKKKKNKREKNDKRNEKKTSKGKKNKNIKNKPKAENNSKKCNVKQSKSTKDVRSKRQARPKRLWRKPQKIFTKHNKPNYPEFEAVIKEINNCLSTAATGSNRFKLIFFTELGKTCCIELLHIFRSDTFILSRVSLLVVP